MLEMFEGSIADMLDARVLIVLSSLGGTAEGSRKEVSGVARMEVSGTARVLMVLSNLGGTAEGSNTEILPPEELLLDLFRLAGGLLDSIIERAGWGVSGLGRFWVAGGGNVGSESVYGFIEAFVILAMAGLEGLAGVTMVLSSLGGIAEGSKAEMSSVDRAMFCVSCICDIA